MQAEHLKGWLEEAHKEENVRVKAAEIEGTAEVLRGTGEEEIEEKREKAPLEMKNW